MIKEEEKHSGKMVDAVKREIIVRSGVIGRESILFVSVVNDEEKDEMGDNLGTKEYRI